MKSFILYLSLLFSLSTQLFASINLEYSEERFHDLIEANLALRSEGIAFYHKHRDKFDKSGSLTGGDLQNIYNFSERYMELRSQMFEYVELAKKEVGPRDNLIIGTDVETRTGRNWYGKKLHYLNPKEEAGELKIRHLKMATIFGLVLFDNYLTLIAPYYSHDKIRYLLNRDFPGDKFQLDKLTESFFNYKQRKILFQGLYLFDRTQDLARIEKYHVSSFERYMNKLVASSPIVDYLRSTGYLDSKVFTHRFKKLHDDLKYTTRGSTYQTSKLFGNAMGIFQSRSGKMKNFTVKQREKISSKLKPLDVLFEKTPFRLTDSFIPGYYGHVAIWVGTEKELKELGLWNHPSIVPYHSMIRAGHHIVEALRPGVQLNTLEHFLDIDDFAAIRPMDLSREQVQDYLVRAFNQVGKAYDFNFDVETDRLIVCSEIAYVVYHHVKWPTDKMMGRYTISPDHVALEALPGGAFYPVTLYQGGVEVADEDKDEVFMQNLTGPEGL